MIDERRLWARVDELIDRAPTGDDLRGHRVEVLAAKRLRETGRNVPLDFVSEERRAAFVSMTASIVLERVRDAYDGPIIVLKGPEVALHYPDPALRVYGDIDVLVRDAQAAHAALRRDGFELVGDPELYEDIHHLRPLMAEGAMLHVEIHSRPKWVEPLPAPRVDELFDAAVASRTGVPGLLALPAEHHALLLAAHSWAHEPLRRLRDIIDVAAVAAAADRDELDRLAARWGMARLWGTTSAAIDALFGDGRPPAAFRIWAQNLALVRERTVLENHLQRLLSDFAALPPTTAIRRLPRRVVDDVRPGADESWRTKGRRTAYALRNAFTPRSRHDLELAERTARAADSASGASDSS